jgi:hypothetical protein
MCRQTVLRTEIYESAPLFKADNAILSFYATKDGKISVSESRKAFPGPRMPAETQ